MGAWPMLVQQPPPNERAKYMPSTHTHAHCYTDSGCAREVGGGVGAHLALCWQTAKQMEILRTPAELPSPQEDKQVMGMSDRQLPYNLWFLC